MKRIQRGDWWNNTKVTTSVLLADFNKQMAKNRRKGNSPKSFTYDVEARLSSIRRFGSQSVI